MIEIFVFGSNLAGKHYGGAAKHALDNYGAVMGQSEGLQGDSYAIPTLDENFSQLSLKKIREAVQRFQLFAALHESKIFKVTAIGCGIAGFKPKQIAPMFKGCSKNCILPDEFIGFLLTSNGDNK
jgi:hypothetical protein